jgi:NAD(P)-dependent dehydrogenase (short-subunit alcohol dehydrogenase family)
VKSRESQSLLFQVTVIQADAADETAIKTVCEEAIQEEGRLDVFFANVRNLVFGSTEAY